MLLGEKKGYAGMAFYLFVLAAMTALLLPALLKAGARKEELRLPVLLYHSVTEAETGEYAVTAETLEDDLKALAERGYETVSLAQLMDFVDGKGSLPEKPILLTFDDGAPGFAQNALPVLQKYGMKAVLSVVGGFSSGEMTETEAMDAQTLRELCLYEGIELQSHSFSLHLYGQRHGARRLEGESEADYRALLERDIWAMEVWAKREGLRLLPGFAYPYGQVEPGAEAILKENGFRATMNSEPYVNLLERDPESLYQLGRLNRAGSLTTEEVLDWVEEGYAKESR